MKCKIVQSVLFHGKHLQQGAVYDFESEHARELTEKGFVIPVKQMIKDLEAVLDDESVQKVTAPVLDNKHPAELADQEAVAEKAKRRKAREAREEEVVDAKIEEEEAEPKKKPARKKNSKKKG